jgi:hypothetical protein
MRHYTLCAALGLMALCAAAFSQEPGDAAQAPRPAKRPVTLTVSTDKPAYTSGEPVKITLKLATTLATPSDFQFGSAQKFDIWIRKGEGLKGDVVWHWAKGKMFAQMLTSAHVTRDAPLTFTATCDKAEAALAPGTYTIIGQLVTMDRAPRLTGNVTFKVK